MSRISSIPMHQTSPKSWQWLQWIRSIGLRIRSLGSNGPMTSSAPAAYLERWADLNTAAHCCPWSISPSAIPKFANWWIFGDTGIPFQYSWSGYPKIGPTNGPFGQKKPLEVARWVASWHVLYPSMGAWRVSLWALASMWTPAKRSWIGCLAHFLDICRYSILFWYNL